MAMQGWLKPGDRHGQAVTLLDLQPALGMLHAKSLLAAVEASWLPCTATPASPAPLSPGCLTSLCWQSQPNHSERAGAVQDLIVQGGEHPHLPMQKLTQCHSQTTIWGCSPREDPGTKAAAPSNPHSTCTRNSQQYVPKHTSLQCS